MAPPAGADHRLLLPARHGLGNALIDFTTGGSPRCAGLRQPGHRRRSGRTGRQGVNRVPIAPITGLSLAPGNEILLRWADIDHAGNDHGLAIDDFSIAANGGADPGALDQRRVGDEGNGGTMTATFTVTVSSPATPA